MRTPLGLIATAVFLVPSVTSQAAADSDPYKNVVGAFVSADGRHTAVCTSVGDKYRVIIDGKIFGPYDDVDCQFSSPWQSSRVGIVVSCLGGQPLPTRGQWRHLRTV